MSEKITHTEKTKKPKRKVTATKIPIKVTPSAAEVRLVSDLTETIAPYEENVKDPYGTATPEPAKSAVRLPARDSATGKAVATSIQVGLALLAYVASDDSFRTLATTYLPQALPIIAISAGALSFVNNVLRRDVANY